MLDRHIFQTQPRTRALDGKEAHALTRSWRTRGSPSGIAIAEACDAYQNEVVTPKRKARVSTG